jgi:hypothetical protein
MLVGLCFAEIACNNDDFGGSCKEAIHELLSIDTSALALYVDDQRAIIGLNEGDSVDLKHMWFTVDFDTREIAYHHPGSWVNIAYATPPCPPPRLESDIDSIKVYQMDNANKDISKELYFLNQPLVDHTGRRTRRFEMYPPFEAEFRFISMGIDEVMTRYAFDFFFADSTTYRSVSPSIYIQTN